MADSTPPDLDALQRIADDHCARWELPPRSVADMTAEERQQVRDQEEVRQTINRERWAELEGMEAAASADRLVRGVPKDAPGGYLTSQEAGDRMWAAAERVCRANYGPVFDRALAGQIADLERVVQVMTALQRPEGPAARALFVQIFETMYAAVIRTTGAIPNPAGFTWADHPDECREALASVIPTVTDNWQLGVWRTTLLRVFDPLPRAIG